MEIHSLTSCEAVKMYFLGVSTLYAGLPQRPVSMYK